MGFELDSGRTFDEIGFGCQAKNMSQNKNKRILI